MSDDYTQHLNKIADWDRTVLAAHCPAGPYREAKELLPQQYEQAVVRATEDVSAESRVAMAQWASVLLILAEAEREQKRPGWEEKWTEVYEHYVL
ncbi:hypothetical protein [Streptomyces tsukubensis]|uniref:hypothetical protein n=1 Tax=Streptomyces tsukubensis TaxID=83656 RepID=UPI00344B62C6